MKQQSITVIAFATSLLLFSQSCNKGEPSPYDTHAIWVCHYESDWNYESTRERIIGSWDWEYVQCCGEATEPSNNGTESQGMTVEFKADGTGTLVDKDAISEFTWDIDTLVYEDRLFEFQTTPFIGRLKGRLLLCDDLMMCANGYIDGSNNFYRKSDPGGN